MKIKNNREGFTIIELIVVIAIIAVLAAIVAISVVQYIAKSKYSAAKAQIDQLQTLAADYFSNNNSYSGFCSSPQVSTIKQAIEGGNLNYVFICMDSSGSVGGSGGYTPLCSSSNKYIGYAVDTLMAPTYSWCVDYTGNRKAAFQQNDCSCY